MTVRRSALCIAALLAPTSTAACGTPEYSCEETYTCPQPAEAGDVEGGEADGAGGASEGASVDTGAETGKDVGKDAETGKGGSGGGGGTGGGGTGGGAGSGGTGGGGGDVDAGGAGGAGGDAGAAGEAGDAGDTGGGGATDAGGDADGATTCGPGTKLCGQSCVTDSNPSTGCAQPACTACNLAHASAICVGGACAVGQCQSGWTDCNGSGADGCEINTDGDPQNCGGCGKKCAPANATPKCAGGACQVASCAGGWGDCDGADANGCEAKLDGDSKNCGTCGHDCQGGLCVGAKCQPVSLVTGQGQGTLTALAVDGSHLYWTKTGPTPVDGVVARTPKAGGSTEVLVFGQNNPNAIAVDGTYLYWLNRGFGVGQGSVWKKAKSGAPESTLATGLDWPTSIAIDGANVYWTADQAGKVLKVPVAGGSVAALATGEANPVAIVVDSSNAYWTNKVQSGAARRAPLLGGAPLTVVALQMPSGVAVSGDWLYWTTFLPNGKVGCVSISNPATECLQLLVPQSFPVAIVADASGVYWLNYDVSGALMRLTPYGALVTGQNLPVALATDPATVYWVEQGAGTIRKLAK